MLLTGVWRKRRSKRMECGHLPAASVAVVHLKGLQLALYAATRWSMRWTSCWTLVNDDGAAQADELKVPCNAGPGDACLSGNRGCDAR